MSNRKDVPSIEKQEVVNELHRHAFKNFARQKVIQKGIYDTLQIDLVEMIPYAKENKSYKYLLTAIDIFSKKAYAKPLKSKKAHDVVLAMESILNEIGEPVKNIQADNGKEWYNKEFRHLMKQRKINFYSTFSSLKASICERFNRTLKNKMWKMFSLNGNYKWINHIEALLKDYNNSFHRTIQMKPNLVTKAIEQQLLKTVYKYTPSNKKGKFKANDHVRISKYKGIFQKGYTPNWSTEIFQIHRVLSTTPPTYIIKDHDSNIISGKFYEKELQKTKYKDVYLVEKVLRKKGSRLYVKWLGLDSSQNSWINKEDFV